MSLKLLVVILWPEVHPISGEDSRNLQRNCFLAGFYHCSSVVLSLVDGGTRFGFIARDKGY